MVTLALKTETAHLLCQSGRVEVLLGPPGSGKSRMLHLLAGLDVDSGAQVFAGGAEVTHLPPALRRMRYVPPGGVVYPALSVLRNLTLTRMGDDAEARARAAADRFALTDVLAERAGELDASTRQRLGFAKAAASGATAVLLDEPFAAIDSTQRGRAKEQVLAAFVARDRILLIATASAALAHELAGNLHVLGAQAVLQRGAPSQLLAQPRNEQVASVLHGGTLAVWPVMLVRDATLGRVVQVVDQVVVPAPAAWDGLAPGAYRLGLGALSVHRERRAAHEIELRAEVVRNEVEGGETTTTLRSHDRNLFMRHAGCHRLPAHEVLAVYFSLGDTLVFSPRGQTLFPSQPAR